jgi:DNA-binding transcriptional ArsR family regulator
VAALHVAADKTAEGLRAGDKRIGTPSPASHPPSPNAGTDITRQAVTKHLHVLANAGIVQDVRASRERLWKLEPARLEKARHSPDLIAGQWDYALNRLKAVLEDEPDAPSR